MSGFRAGLTYRCGAPRRLSAATLISRGILFMCLGRVVKHSWKVLRETLIMQQSLPHLLAWQVPGCGRQYCDVVLVLR